MGVAREVAAAMSWSLPYTLGVFTRRKMAAVYCQAVLSHGQRIGLDGSPAEMVDAEAKELATKQLAQLEARKVAKKAAEMAAAASEAEACPDAPDRDGAIAQPRACRFLAPARVKDRRGSPWTGCRVNAERRRP
jgi:sRNA-binding protein